MESPPRADVLVLGGGTAGCVLAARLSEDPGRSVLLIEAGPDYGRHDDGGWPTEMLDPRSPPDTHDWDPEGELSLARARVIGGCSAHNACFVVRAHPDDYEEWGVPGWGNEDLAPYVGKSELAIATRPLADEEIGPWSRAVIEGAEAAGIGVLDDFNAPRDGVARLPVNVSHASRWNTAFAYLDQARGRDNLTVLDRALADHLVVDRGRAVGAVVDRGGKALEVQAGTIVVSSGALGSPLILLRSGIGPAGQLGEHGIEVASELDGVGANLQDHFGVVVVFRPTEALSAALSEQAKGGRMIASGSIVKARSSRCPEGSWDLHLVTWASPDTEGLTGRDWRVQLSVYAMKPASRGSVRLRDRDAESHPRVELGYISDPDGHDLGAIADGIEIARRIAGTAPLAELVDGEVVPGPQVSDTDAFIEEHVRGYFHPVGTCGMGVGHDPGAVVDGACRVRGVEGLRVGDASVMPTIPRSNTNLTTIAIAERLSDLVAGEERSG